MNPRDEITVDAMATPGPLDDSALTWVEPGQRAPRVPDELLVDRSLPWWRKLDGWRHRFEVRDKHAAAFLEASKHPERGLPVADNHAVLEFLRGLLRTRRGMVVLLVGLNALAGVAGLLVPRILGKLIDEAGRGGSGLSDRLDQIALTVVGVVVVQSLLIYLARWTSSIFGQEILAEAREQIVRFVLRLPLSKVEQASSGDLVTRVTRDVGAMSDAVRWGVPQLVVSVVMLVLSMVAVVLNSWLLAIPSLVSFAILLWCLVPYLERAPRGYITESASYSTINTTLTESIEGARTIEALGMQRERLARTRDDIEESSQTERYTTTIRNIMFLTMDYCYRGPLVLILLFGAWGYSRDMVTLGQITAAALYAEQLIEPLDRLVAVLDRLQVGAASTTRLLGIASVPVDREATDEVPDGDRMIASDLHFAYRKGHDVLHGIDLELVPGERLAIVGPSGSGKSTIARLLAGINAPRVGTVSVGGVDVMHLPLERLRSDVALVTQEHHVFVGSIRDNIVLAREGRTSDDQVWGALDAVAARDWVERLPDGLDTMVGSGNVALTPAQAQQVALARLVVADPHTLVLDEATSLIDPTTARHLEGSMSSLLSGRSVVAIAHRLHTAHDADRIAVVIDGRIAELGSHDELMARDGEYAALWRAWTS